MYKNKPKLHALQAAHKAGEFRTLSVDVTSRCNMKCPHCYAEPFKNRPDADLETMCAAIREARSMGAYHFVFQGGEPITEPGRLEAMIKATEPDSAYINVVSNGWEMTVDKIEWLGDLGVDKIAYSLDSGIEKEHNAVRGNGSFDRVLNSIMSTDDAGILASISLVVTRQSFGSEGFWSAYTFAFDSKIRIDLQIAEPVGLWEGNLDALVTPEQTQFIQMLRKYSPILPNGQKMVNRDLFTMDDQSCCPAGREFMAITSDGHILPCNFLQFTLGKVGKVKLKDARDRLLKSTWFSYPCGRCLCGEDRTFIEKFITPYVGKTKPLDASLLFL